jgi:hypothetical protein
MTQVDRDRLVALRKAKKKLITQKEAAGELGITERQVRRLLKALKRRGDQAVVHALRGQRSNRKLDEDVKKEALKILSQEMYRGFGPTLASEYLAKTHKIEVSRETLRKVMIEGKLWRARTQRVGKVHLWRERRSRYGEMVQWDTSEHDWLEGRGEKMLLIAMIDDATSRRMARFVRSDSTAENMDVLERYLKRHGRPLAYYTDKASLFQTAIKTRRDQQREGKDRPPMRVAGVTTLEQANQYLEEEYLPWCNATLAVMAATADDAHRPLEKHHDLAAILSHVETRQVANDYTVQYESKIYRIDSKDIRARLRGASVRVEKRKDGSTAMRFGDRYLTITVCESRQKVAKAKPAAQASQRALPRKSDWNKKFDLKKAPKVWQAAAGSGARLEEGW